MNDSRLKLNDKTEFLITGTQRQRDKIKNGFHIILLRQYVSTLNLEVPFDDNLNFREHVSQI